MIRNQRVGLADPDARREDDRGSQSRSEAGVMSYFKTILDLRLDYTDWLNRRGVELPARLRTAAGAMVGFETVCEKHAVIGDSQFAVEKITELAHKNRRDEVAHLVQYRHGATRGGERVDAAVRDGSDAEALIRIGVLE